MSGPVTIPSVGGYQSAGYFPGLPAPVVEHHGSDVWLIWPLRPNLKFRGGQRRQIVIWPVRRVEHERDRIAGIIKRILADDGKPISALLDHSDGRA